MPQDQNPPLVHTKLVLQEAFVRESHENPIQNIKTIKKENVSKVPLVPCTRKFHVKIHTSVKMEILIP
jgi:hypothetical protein